ncbi:MAG: AAA family ATPase [Verrucomicrobiota bacterium]|jgi:predicted ATPase
MARSNLAAEYCQHRNNTDEVPGFSCSNPSTRPFDTDSDSDPDPELASPLTFSDDRERIAPHAAEVALGPFMDQGDAAFLSVLLRGGGRLLNNIVEAIRRSRREPPRHYAPRAGLVKAGMRTEAPYLTRLYVKPGLELDRGHFPMSLPFTLDLDLEFQNAVTFFVGENGSGKSTLLEAIAQFCDLPVAGGGKNELADMQGPHATSELAPYLRAGFKRKPRDGYFFRAEFHAHFATLLDQRRADPDFMGDPYARYGGRSLHARSHGEAFLAMFSAWMSPGIILMDEPESALSPQRQLVLLAQMAGLASRGGVQFIIATHSPIMLTFPGALLLSFDGGTIRPTQLQATEHYQITRGILENPEQYWRHLASDADDDQPAR